MADTTTDTGRHERLAIFGGTFNPIHRGHTRVALDVQARFDLACIHFVPSAQPPHKPGHGLAPAADRLAMVQMALADDPRLVASDVEIRRPGWSYSYETIRQFKARAGGGALYFILGQDAFFEIHTWHAYRRLFDEAAFVVMSRPQGGRSSDRFERLQAYLQTHISNRYRMDRAHRCCRHPDKQRVYHVDVAPVPISSSQIRQMIRNGQDISDWVDPAVKTFIDQKGLYR